MILTLPQFIARLERVSYLQYALYQQNENLFITLYASEELEKYLIFESISPTQHPAIIQALEQHKQPLNFVRNQ